MFNKIYFSFMWWSLSLLNTIAADMWSQVCDSGLPGCKTNITSDEGFFDYMGNIISQLILYVAVFSVIAVTASGIMYMLSMWEDAKATKAKKWIMWSLVGLILSVTAWSIINLVNGLQLK